MIPTRYVSQIGIATYDVISTDIFDTILMRDLSSEKARLHEAARDAAIRLNLNPCRLAQLRVSLQSIAYKAVAAERPAGDVSLTRICRTVATAMGIGPDIVPTLREAEIEMEIRHLFANRSLIAAYYMLATLGKRVIAITDTYYSLADINRLLNEVVGDHPIVHVYSSSDLGLTKHAGGLFAEVAHREDVLPSRILHFGDNFHADVYQARAAGYQAVHLPRSTNLRRAGKIAARIPALLHLKGYRR